MTLAREKRRSFRVPVPATALMWRRGRFAGGYRVSDISIGGCGIDQGPLCDIGELYDLALRVDDPEFEDGLRCPVEVVRRRGSILGLRFVDAGAGTEDSIHDLVLRCLEQEQSARGQVLLVHSRPEHVTPTVRALEALGHRVHIACTPLQAVWILENNREYIHTTVVARRLGSHDGLDMIRFMSERHPRIRRVLLWERKPVQALQSRGRAHAILTHPFDLDSLRSVVLEPPDESMIA